MPADVAGKDPFMELDLVQVFRVQLFVMRLRLSLTPRADVR